ncbi:MAG: rhodanese-like domain-containing protein [Phycisphaeraceae bacterium]|nr:rhodanese-like domain-containing protein [Phycisphaeraceae bacterium]
MANSTQGLSEIDAATLKGWLDSQQALLIDVREPVEHGAEKIPGALLVPLTGFDPAQVPAAGDKKLVLHCKGGMRSRKAGEILVAGGRGAVYSLTGGIEAWKQAGLPVQRAERKIIEVQQQVFIVISIMILAGLALGVWVNPWWLLLPTFAGLGLLNAGLTGFCPLLTVMAKMPWNQVKSTCSSGGASGGGCGCGH